MSSVDPNRPPDPPALAAVSDHDLLRAFLACEGLPDNWHDSYGVREARSNALTRRSTRKSGHSSDSFSNPNSETALTLFALGNTDGWRQTTAFTHAPRVRGDRWNRRYFAALPTLPARPAGNSLWRHHVDDGSLFRDDAVDWDRLVLLFEVEVAGKAFHQRTAKADKFTALSFLKVDDLEKWSKFDAVLIDPANKCFYFIEAKLGSDSSMGTKKYPHVNQIVRSLEAAYWITAHHDSKYHGWAFRYVFVSPRLIHDHKLRYYAFALDAVDRLLDGYHRLLTEVYRSDLRLDAAAFDRQYTAFRDRAREAVRVVHWDAFGKVLMDHRPQVWDGYFDRIAERCVVARPEWDAARVVLSIKRRLRLAGVDFRV